MSEILHSRKQPLQWGELHDVAIELVAHSTVPESPYDAASIDEMIDRSLVLDDDALEACSYYSIGQGMCNLLAWLNTGDNQQIATETLRNQFQQRGRLALNFDLLPDTPFLNERSAVRHTERLRCPAMNVGNLALLKSSLEMVWQASHTHGA